MCLCVRVSRSEVRVVTPRRSCSLGVAVGRGPFVMAREMMRARLAGEGQEEEDEEEGREACAPPVLPLQSLTRVSP